MSDDLPSQNNNPNPWNTPQSIVPEVPNTPNPSPAPPNSNTVDPVQSWVAQHEQRDTSGKFIKSDHYPSNSSNLPPPVSFTGNNKYSEKNDPPRRSPKK